MNETYNSQNPNTGKQPRNPKESTSSERLATCSMIAGITGMICSFFYFPVSLVSGSNTPTGMICGIIGIVLAIMSRNADVSGKKSFNARAITGIVLSGLAIAAIVGILLNAVLPGNDYEFGKDLEGDTAVNFKV